MVGLSAGAILLAGCGGETSEEHTRSLKEAEQADTLYADLGIKMQPGTSSESMVDAPTKRAYTETPEDLPRLVDLGRGTCIPCKRMAPILEELKEAYRGRAIVEVIDLREDPGAAGRYGIRLIPTQVFFDRAGKEVWRHEGFLAREAIIAKLTEMGVEALDN
jgi:thiol-disulfide isomerase/thioredoxin